MNKKKTSPLKKYRIFFIQAVDTLEESNFTKECTRTWKGCINYICGLMGDFPDMDPILVTEAS